MISITVDSKAVADVTAFTRLEFFDESRSTLMPMIEEGGA